MFLFAFRFFDLFIFSLSTYEKYLKARESLCVQQVVRIYCWFTVFTLFDDSGQVNMLKNIFRFLCPFPLIKGDNCRRPITLCISNKLYSYYWPPSKIKGSRLTLLCKGVLLHASAKVATPHKESTQDKLCASSSSCLEF